VRTFTRKLRVSNLPGAVWMRASMRRRSSAFTVVVVSASGSPRLTRDSIVALLGYPHGKIERLITGKEIVIERIVAFALHRLYGRSGLEPIAEFAGVHGGGSNFRVPAHRLARSEIEFEACLPVRDIQAARRNE